MNKEIDFFIKEYAKELNPWTYDAIQRKSIIVGSKDQLFDILTKITKSGDEISCSISGAWLDVCIYRAVRDLLSSQSQNLLPGRNITAVNVDLTKSLAFEERISPVLSISQRLKLISHLLGKDLISDTRLQITNK